MQDLQSVLIHDATHFNRADLFNEPTDQQPT